jgi:hypothetical protein
MVSVGEGGRSKLGYRRNVKCGGRPEIPYEVTKGGGNVGTTWVGWKACCFSCCSMTNVLAKEKLKKMYLEAGSRGQCHNTYYVFNVQSRWQVKVGFRREQNLASVARRVATVVGGWRDEILVGENI